MAPTGSRAFKGETLTSSPRHGGNLEQRRGCCNLVGGGQKPFITKMPAGRSLWSPRDDCASVGVGVHTGWGLLFGVTTVRAGVSTQPPGLALCHPSSPSPSPPLCRSSSTTKGPRFNAPQSTRDAYTHTNTHILASSTRLHAQSLLEQAGASRRVNLHPAAPRPTL